MDGYTIEELMEYSGLARGTLYDLTYFKVLSPPIRGIHDNGGSKGLYPTVVKKELDRFRELKLAGLKRKEIIAIMTAERETALNVSLCKRAG